MVLNHSTSFKYQPVYFKFNFVLYIHILLYLITIKLYSMYGVLFYLKVTCHVCYYQKISININAVMHLFII